VDEQEATRRSVILTKTKAHSKATKVSLPSPIMHSLYRGVYSIDVDCDEHLLYLGQKIARLREGKMGMVSAQEVVDAYGSANALGSILLFHE
jgi:hypothetical protein